MEKVPFLFCVHNHQPVGNFPHILENAYQKAYFPLIEVVKKYPFMKMSLHYSGILWDFFRKHHPDFLKTLRLMVESGQLEMITGGYYEPILPVIPDEHRIDQIRKLTRTIQEETGATPRGVWLAERVWEPHLPASLVEAGVEYVTVDDYHFKKAGLRQEDLFGYYLTEERGKVIKVFPGSETLRYIIPFHVPEETLDFLSRLRASSGAAIFADDGEKFGIWPYTYHSVYEEAWLDRLFEILGKNLDWVEPMTFGDYASREAPLGRIYLPSASYMEMDEWSLPTEAMIEYGKVVQALKERSDGARTGRFIKGGFWRNFFVKYPESNDLHKRVLSLWEKAREGKSKVLQNQQFVTHLYQAECNDAYWHGVFGGLYLPHLRLALYEHLIKAEALYDEAVARKRDWPDLERSDFNSDGDEEVLLKNREAVLLFSRRGGALLEMDHRAKAFNILSSLTRRKEGYHRKVEEAGERSAGAEGKTIHEIFDSKEEGLDRYLHFDGYRKVSFLDHFIAGTPDIETFRRCEYPEEGDFLTGLFDISVTQEDENRGLILSRSGRIRRNDREARVDVRKHFSLLKGQAAVEARYTLFNRSEEEIRSTFGVEFNINLLAGDAPDRYYRISGPPLEDRKLASLGESRNLYEIELVDEWAGIRVALNTQREASLWRFPIYTVSLSESGFEKIFQGSSLLLFWPLQLNPGEAFEADITLRVSSF